MLKQNFAQMFVLCAEKNNEILSYWINDGDEAVR